MFKNLNKIDYKEILPGFNVKFAHSKNMTVAMWKIDKGSSLPEHSHPHEQIAMVIEGEFELTIGDETKKVTNGLVGIIPSNIIHKGRAITDCKIIDVFYPVREDYKEK